MCLQVLVSCFIRFLPVSGRPLGIVEGVLLSTALGRIVISVLSVFLFPQVVVGLLVLERPAR